jgi:hypothetical protein
MATPSAYNVISTQLPKWWKELKDRKGEFNVTDAAEMIIPQSPSDAALMAVGGPVGKGAKLALGGLASVLHSPDADAGPLFKIAQLLEKMKPSKPTRVMDALDMRHGFGSKKVP